MKEAFEKILERFDAKKQYFQKFYEADGKTEEDEYINKATQLAFDDAKNIVQKVAEEYNNSWIPCSERLPEEHKLYDITFKNDAGIHSDSAIYNPYLKRWLWDADETELVENEVLAWADKREPYQPKRE